MSQTSPKSAKWRAWEVVPRASLPKGTSVTRVKWVLKVQTDETGAVIKYKARITPKGFMQRHGVDYFEVYAFNWHVQDLTSGPKYRSCIDLLQYDVPQAFTQADRAEWMAAYEALTLVNITDLGESKFMLGMRITRDRAARTLKLDQELYVTKALERFGLLVCTPRSTPSRVSNDAQDDEARPTTDSEAPSEVDTPCDLKLYQEKVGTLLYAAISTRLDISFAVNKLTQKMQAPTVRDARACDRVFRYLAGTKELGLRFGRARTDASAPEVIVSAWADADWASDRVDRKSITGWVAMINGDPVSWASKKQKVVALSTCEAELYAESAVIQETLWLKDLLSEISLRVPSPPLIHGDNQSTIGLSKNGIKSERTKHVAIKYAHIFDEVSKENVRLKWVPSAEQLADIFSKALGRPVYERLRSQLMTC